MQNIGTYIIESLAKKENIVVFDVDDTLLTADSSILKVLKYPNGDRSKKPISMTTREYADDKDAQNVSWYDFSDFKNYSKVYKSIMNGAPIIKNLKILDYYLNNGYEFAFLTARSNEDAVAVALNSFLEYRGADGKLHKLGKKFNKNVSKAVNDPKKGYPGANDAQKKALALREICFMYKNAVYIDDDKKNIEAAKSLGLPNLKVIKSKN